MNLSDVPEEDEPPSYESVVTDGLDEGEVDYHKPEEIESSSAWVRNEQLDRHERGHCIEKEGTFNDITSNWFTPNYTYLIDYLIKLQ